MDYARAFGDALARIHSEGRYRVFADISRTRGAFPKAMRHDPEGVRDVTVWCSNDYLGMGQHPAVLSAMHEAIDNVGAGSGGTRNISGTTHYHVELEEKLAHFLGREACHVHAAGYISCLTSIASFAQKGDVILADKNIHSCLWDGVRLSMAKMERFSHKNPEDLREVESSVDERHAKM